MLPREEKHVRLISLPGFKVLSALSIPEDWTLRYIRTYLYLSGVTSQHIYSTFQLLVFFFQNIHSTHYNYLLKYTVLECCEHNAINDVSNICIR